MSQRVALIDDSGTVVNVATFPDGWEGEAWNGFTAQRLGEGEKVGPGWVRVNGEWHRPQVEPGVDLDGALDAMEDTLSRGSCASR